MPKIRRRQLPAAVLAHLLRRVRERQVSTEQLAALSDWLATDPTVPQGRWFKRFSDFTICGEDELVRTFLLPNQLPDGQELF